MAVTDLFAGEIATELLKALFQIVRKSTVCKSTAESLMATINELLPIIQEVKFSGVELPPFRQSQLDHLSQTLKEGLELSNKVLNSTRWWNLYRTHQLARKMEKIEKRVSLFVHGPMQAHILADVHHLRFESEERFDRLEKRIGELRIGNGRLDRENMELGWWEEEVAEKGSLGNLVCGVGVEVGMKKVKEIVMVDREEFSVVGIVGIGGSGKTTLATRVCGDDQVRSYFKDRILFLTVSQSPNLENLKARIKGFVAGSDGIAMSGNLDYDGIFPNWNLQPGYRIDGVKKLIVLDDVWSLSVLEQLVFRVPGLKTLVVSRFKFPMFNCTHEVELLRKDEALSLFCLSAFGHKSIPPGADANLVQQIVDECEGLPLALKVIGAALKDQPEMYWASAKKRLSRGEPICDAHKNKLLDRMAISVQFLPKKVRECFLDLGCFPEDKKIPLDVLINMWAEVHDLDKDEAFAILVELADKNLLTLIKDPRAGDLYSCCYNILVTQHDVLRDLALHLSSLEEINQRKRLLMPKREVELPREWEKNADQPFNAQIVSIHTGEMNEMDWFRMEFPKAEVLILNFTGNVYFLPPFIDDMPKLRALIVINSGTRPAAVKNFSVFFNLTNLRSLWLEKVSTGLLSESTIPLRNLRKISLVLCKISNSFDQSVIELHRIFPSLVEFAIDHCDDLLKLHSSICSMQTLRSLSITNCHNLNELPEDIGNLKSLHILRLYACPNLKMLPASVCDLVCLEYIDISQCVNLKSLPQWIGKLSRLEKIDMRECPQISDLPKSAASLSLRAVICDEEVSWFWKDIGRSNLHVQIAEKCFSLDWLDE